MGKEREERERERREEERRGRGRRREGEERGRGERREERERVEERVVRKGNIKTRRFRRVFGVQDIMGEVERF